MTILFLTICVLLLTLPFLPAFREWQSPADCAPLPISRHYANEIDHFADQFRDNVKEKMSGRAGEASKYFDYVSQPTETMEWSAPSRPLIALQAIKSSTAIRCLQPLYATAEVDCARDSSFAALYAEDAVQLGPYSEILEWGHAEGPITLDVACVTLRRLSSKVAVNFSAQCCFERVNAPIIRFADLPADTPPPEAMGGFLADIDQLPNAIRRTPTLHLIKGDCSLPPGHVFKGSLVVTGRLIIGNYTTIIGDVKVREGTIVGNGVRIIGSLTCEDRIYILDHAQVAGPLISETDIVLGAGAIIGRIDSPTTVSAENIIAKSGAVAHGTLWARNVGVVWAP